ncbi:MAG: RNA 2'-phosphotransferase [Desulfosarcina sp.]|jgi:putative RNA 2'-phosphotransferase
MKRRHSVAKLSKFLFYMLGRQPDEFGLVPDAHGYVSVKDLMKALAEEPGWRHVRVNHVREVILTSRSPAIEMQHSRVRAVNRTHLVAPQLAESIPKLLYFPIRRRAYPHVSENGLGPITQGRRIVLADNRPMAERLGKRIDPSPIILTVSAKQAREHGAIAWCFGKQLYLFDRLPPGCFSGPPLPKSRPIPQKSPVEASAATPKAPGTYLIDLSGGATAKKRSAKGPSHRKNEWKRERKRKSRRHTFHATDH